MNKDGSTPKKAILWGATGHAKVLRECLAHSSIEIVALFDNNPNVKPPFDDVPLMYGKKGFDDWLASRGIEPVGFLVAIGGSRGRERVVIQAQLESASLIPLIALHPMAFIASTAHVGPGSQVLAQSAVCVDASIGPGCIINSGATVDHDCRLGHGVHIGPGAHVAGEVILGNYSTVYTGAAVIPRVRIGEGAVVGAGAVVIDDVPDYTVVAGNPARILKNAR